MDKNKIKTFAVWARRNLIAAVADRAFKIGIEENNIQEIETVQGGFKLKGKEEIFNISPVHRDKLISEIKEKGFNQVMEEVAYTWFNRFMGIRYMEVNEYLPTGIRVLSSAVDGKTEPDVLTRVSEVVDELKLDAEYIYELLDSGKTEDREKAYKYILVKQCNELGKIIPQMFEKISDYTELLLPDNLLEESSIIRKMVADIGEEDWKEEVEIVGWMYQYYISEKKDEVFAALKNNVKITKENIPAATQLFTPKWIVKYMVENSLGRLWLEGHPNKELQEQFKYYLEEAEQETEVEEELKKIREEHSRLRPEDIKVLDPCMGSGHILVYAFDVLYEIYKTAGYSEREIPRMILQNNLYGLDIDDRAAQLASFALIMKARHYNRRLFREMERERLDFNLCSIQESNGISKASIDYFAGNNEEVRKDVENLVDTFSDAKEYGSILIVKKINFDIIEDRLKEIELEDSLIFADYRKLLLNKIPELIKQGIIMSNKYDSCITNPPYMSSNGVGSKLLKYLKENHLDSGSDLFAVFMEVNRLKKTGYLAMINQHSWMFLSSFEKLRENVIDTKIIINMLHLGPRTFEELSGEVVQSTSFVFNNCKIEKYISQYFRLVEERTSEKKRNRLLNSIKNSADECRYSISTEKLKYIPGRPIAYWVSDNTTNNFERGEQLCNYGSSCKGMGTGKNDKFIRYWHEVELKNIKGHGNTTDKWVSYKKGGEFRKWYGNNDCIVYWENNGNGIKSQGNSYVRNEKFFFKGGIEWTKISSYKIGARFYEEGYIFDDASCCFFSSDKLNQFYILAYLNSIVCNKLLDIINPTLNFTNGTIAKLPLIFRETEVDYISRIVEENIRLSCVDWNFFETSWQFKLHPLLKSLDSNDKKSSIRLSLLFNIWETEAEDSFNQLRHNEEELNRIFIDIYGLQDELTPNVEDKDITIRKADSVRDIKSFISYAVGCILGRYSIDAEGLIYAGGEFKDKWNISEGKCRNIEKDEEGNITCDTWVDATLLPDADNVIPITEDEYFEDDIVSRFIEFVRTVYSEETLEENLDFIADSIGRKPSETSKQAIRRYFVKDFYKDHLKVYQKRPIYWLFESGKNDGFKALVYMHRYNESTVAKVRTDYLHVLQRKYEAEMNRLQLVADSEEYVTRDRVVAKKKLDRISKQIEECREYDQVVAHLANEKIYIDLDDGVMVNYAKFQGVKVINSKDKEVKMDLLAKI